MSANKFIKNRNQNI